MRYYVIAGEASGDLHGANLLRALKAQDPQAVIQAWGGDRMQEAGAHIVKHYRDLAFMGFVQVILNLSTILKNLRFCKRDICEFKPDVLILIDYPGFNLKIAKWAKQAGYKVVYYIAPQVWAWHKSRVKLLKRDVDQLLIILPFEADFFKKHHVKATFVGHPLKEALANHQARSLPHSDDTRPIIAILPGSRRQEIETLLPLQLSIVKQFPQYRFIVAANKQSSPERYIQLIGDSPVEIVYGQTYDLLSVAFAALVKSGTGTLETALMMVPQVVCYKGDAISFQIAKRLVKVPFISLVNLIAGRLVVKELIQNDLNTRLLKEALIELSDPKHRQRMKEDYLSIAHALGNRGASEEAAAQISKMLKF